MTAKEYLSQAKYLDVRINAKINQLSSLNDLATKATSTISDMPKSMNSATSSLENTVVKIITLQTEINKDIDSLVDLKREIAAVINKVEDVRLRLILEKRYLSYEKWEMIAVDMQTEIRTIYREHGYALEEVEKILNSAESCQ